MVKPKSSRPVRSGSAASGVDPQTQEAITRNIIGVCLMFAGLVGFACLFGPAQQGELLDKARHALQFIAGWGAFAIPLLLTFVAVQFMRAQTNISINRVMIGWLLVFLGFVFALNIWFNRPETFKAAVKRQAASGTAAVSSSGAPPDPLQQEQTHEWSVQEAPSTFVEATGGLVGWLIVPVRILAGDLVSVLIVLMFFVVATMLITERSLPQLIGSLQSSLVGLFSFSGAAEPTESDRQSDFDEPEPSTPRRPLLKGLFGGLFGQPKSGPAIVGLPDDEAETRPAPSGNPLMSMYRNVSGGFRSGGRINDPAAEQETAPAPPIREQPEPARAAAEPPSLPARAEQPAAARPAPVARAADASIDPIAAQLAIPLFALPPLDLLKAPTPGPATRSKGEIQDRAMTIEKTLDQFGIKAEVTEVASGPTVTRYEISLAPGIKVSKIVGLADNLSMSLAAIDVRVEAPIPGKAAIGLEVPNNTRTPVLLRECLENPEFQNAESKLTVVLGKDVSGQFKYADLTRMPHLLIGGSTNSGKSVCLNVLIASLVYRASPREVKMLMIDPKRVELSLWEGIPHLMHPVVTDVKMAAGIFRQAIKEMDRRYDLFHALGTRNIDGYNQKVPETDKLPYLVLIVDELADLMMQQGAEVEQSICRLAQLARATGIHLVIATQRPSVDIITGTIKANISSRIAFAVASQVDSRTILDTVGADRLIGKGDMLFMPIDAPKPLRIQGAYLSEDETYELVKFLKEQERPQYTFTVSSDGGSSESDGGLNNSEEVDDSHFEQAVRFVVNNGHASTSMLQRRFRIGYTRAGRIVDMMQERNIVGPLNGAKPREILISRDEMERMFNPGGPIPSVSGYADEGD